MNNFYASVECMLDPSLKKYPVAVCGSVEERHGIVLAKNYKAKAFNVQTGDAVWQAKEKCKDLVIDTMKKVIRTEELEANVLRQGLMNNPDPNVSPFQRSVRYEDEIFEKQERAKAEEARRAKEEAARKEEKKIQDAKDAVVGEKFDKALSEAEKNAPQIELPQDMGRKAGPKLTTALDEAKKAYENALESGNAKEADLYRHRRHHGEHRWQAGRQGADGEGAQGQGGAEEYAAQRRQRAAAKPEQRAAKPEQRPCDKKSAKKINRSRPSWAARCNGHGKKHTPGVLFADFSAWTKTIFW